MRSNGRPINLNLNSQMDYQRQQERLKAMSSTPNKVKSLTADLMIENLLKGPTFKSAQNDRPDIQIDLPLWLRCESPMSPPEYRYLWSLVQSGINMADTQKVSQLLLTSGLHLDILGHIWNLANRAVPGQLTKQEFYIVLALVNLAQTGATFNNLSILKLVQTPVLPVLQPDVLRRQQTQSQSFSKGDHPQVNLKQQFSNIMTPKPVQPVNNLGEINHKSNFNYDMNRTSIPVVPEKSDMNSYSDGSSGKLSIQNVSQVFSSNFHSPSNFPCIGSSPTTELEDDFSDFQSVTAENQTPDLTSSRVNQEQMDEFTDFQSASVQLSDPFETVIVQQKREIPKIPLPKSLTGKFTNIKSSALKISPESERKLKVLSRNESLSSLPESKISTTNKVSTSISVLGSNHGIGSRLANHSLSLKSGRPKLHKHHKTKSSPNSSSPETDGEIIFGVKTKNLESVIPKCCPKKSTTFILKETKINDRESPETSSDTGNEAVMESRFNSAGTCSRENTRKLEIPMLGTFNETVLPTQTKLPVAGSGNISVPDLFSVVEDKYSALRELELNQNVTDESFVPSSEVVNDDFGDFLSANIPPASFAVSGETSSTVDVVPVSASAESVEAEDKDNWGEWNCSTGPKEEPVKDSVPVLDNPEMKIEPSSTAGSSNYDPFNLLCLEEELRLEPSTTTGYEQVPSGNDDPFLNFSSPSKESTSEPKGVLDDFEMTFDLSQSSQPINADVAMPANAIVPENVTWDLFGGSNTPTPIPSGSGNLSRHDSLPSLDFKMSSNEESEQEVVWRKCLETCQCIIQEGVDLLESVVERDVLKEIFTFPKTSDYINGLKIAYEITKRINLNYGEPHPVQEDLKRMWSKLEKLSVEFNIQMKEDLDTVPEGPSQCKICLGHVGHDYINHGEHAYHPSCANLWVNCIDGNLPFSS